MRFLALLLFTDASDSEKGVVFGPWGTVASTEPVATSKVLSIVAGEEKVVERVVRRTVDDLLERRVADHVRVVDENRPQVDKDKQPNADHAVKREDEGEDVVWKRLGVSVKRVEGVRGERRWDKPLVVGLVNVLVQPRMVLESVDPVNGGIGKHEEEWYRKNGVPETVVRDVAVQLAVSSHFEHEPGHGHQVEGEESTERAFDLKSDLVLEETRMLHHLLVEDKVV